MIPRFVLALWRERWAKPPGSMLLRPYVLGKVKRWSDRLVHASVWSLPALGGIGAAFCLLLACSMLAVRFSFNSQVLIASLLVGCAVFLRRYAGMLVTLVLGALALLFSLRYLLWRFTGTLGHELDLDFMLGFALCAAELYLFALTVTTFIRHVWPLTRAPALLPDEPASWPTVDVFLTCHGLSEDAIRAAAQRAMALEWPKKKIVVHLLDDSDRAALTALADAIGARYHPHHAESENAGGKADSVNRALPQSGGDLIVLLDGEYSPARNFLKTISGWFVRDHGLGMLQTPQHFLSPPPSRYSLQQFDAEPTPGSCAVFRRRMLVEAGGVEAELVTWQPHTAQRLAALGYGTAYFGPARQADEDQSPMVPMVRLDHPFSVIALRAKQGLLALEKMLRFYYLVPRLIFFAAPLAYLLLGADIIQTAPELLAAYGLPHLLLGYIAHARVNGQHRLTVVAELRESLLAWYLLLPTAFNVVRTELAKLGRLFSMDGERQVEPFDWMIATPFSIVLVLQCAGLVAGSARLATASAAEGQIAGLYLGWCAVNFLLLVALLGVAEEARQIRRQIRVKARMPAMIKLPLGRAVSCATENFPAADLLLRLPLPVPLEAGTEISLSLFQDYREFAFPAQVIGQRDDVLRVRIDARMRAEYDELGAAVLARGADWPKWLAGRNADRPIPAWISGGVIKLLIAGLDFATHSGQYLRWLHVDSWIQLWKKEK